MSTLNFNVSGPVANDTPSIIADNPPGGTPLAGHFEGTPPNRFVVTVPSTITGGATLTYQHGQKHVRVIVPPGDGSWEAGAPPCQPPGDPAVLMAYTPALARLEPDGTALKNHVWAQMTGFCDYALWLTDKSRLFSLWDQAVGLGANGRRVLGMMEYITRFHPQDFPTFYSELRPFAGAAADRGLRLHFDVFADNQIINMGISHWTRVCEQLGPIPSVVIGAGNEWPKNGFDPKALAYPGVISSQGSTTADSAPPMPGWGIRMWHGRRDYPKVYMSFDDAVYVGRGLDEGGHQYAPVSPIVHDEPMGFAEVDVANRRSTDPALARSLMLTGRAYGSGATFHSEDAMYGRLLGPVQQTCARAFFDAQG